MMGKKMKSFRTVQNNEAVFQLNELGLKIKKEIKSSERQLLKVRNQYDEALKKFTKTELISVCKEINSRLENTFIKIKSANVYKGAIRIHLKNKYEREANLHKRYIQEVLGLNGMFNAKLINKNRYQESSVIELTLTKQYLKKNHNLISF